jgi:hypothetical protein
MRRDTLQQAVRAKPFKPFRLITTEGGSYLVRHPELCVIGNNDVFVTLNKAGETDPDWDDFAVVDLSDVAKYEVVKDATTPTQSGPQAS